MNSVYEKLLNRAVDGNSVAGWLQFLNNNSVEQLEATIAEVPAEFYADAGSTSSGFLNLLYRDLLDRGVDVSGQGFFSAELNAGVSRYTVALQILNSPEFQRDVVESDFTNFLHRLARTRAGSTTLQHCSQTALATRPSWRTSSPQRRLRLCDERSESTVGIGPVRGQHWRIVAAIPEPSSFFVARGAQFARRVPFRPGFAPPPAPTFGGMSRNCLPVPGASRARHIEAAKPKMAHGFRSRSRPTGWTSHFSVAGSDAPCPPPESRGGG